MLDIKFKLEPGHTRERNWMEPAHLRALIWNVTYMCNFRCGICFTNGGQPHPGELNTQEAIDMINNAHASGVKDIIISGGEPFLREDLVTILTHIANLEMTTRIASNGSLLTSELLNRLRNDTLTKSFQISLDTLDPNLFNKIHGASSGVLKSVLKNLQNIQKYGFHTTVSVRLTQQTLSGIPQIINTAYMEGWKTVTIHFPLNTKRADGSLPQDSDFLSLLRPAFEHFCALPHRWLIETWVPWAQYHPEIKRLQKNIRFVHRGCTAGRDNLTISPSGWISPCVCLDLKPAYIGNVKRDKIVDVFCNSPVCDMMRHPEKYSICDQCPNLPTCGGGCRAAAFVLTGQLNGQDKSCPIWRSKMRVRKADAHDLT